jgi:hypothetical protein
MIEGFRAQLDNMPNEMHRVGTHRDKREFIKHKSCNKGYISDEQL